MKRSYASVMFVGLLAVSTAGAESSIVGRASVIDGDTIEITGERIRLYGIDAPESSQRCEDGDGGTYRCGKEAAFSLDKFLATSRPTRCDVVGRDRYRRLIGVCFLADGREVNRWLVQSGNAMDWKKYSKGAYAEEQHLARSRGAGIWRGKFELPCQVRADRLKQSPAC